MIRSASLASAAMLAATIASASADPIAVANASFETLPAGGLPIGACGLGCSYSYDDIPGWTITGSTGQFQPGTSSGNTSYFTTGLTGLTVAFTNGGSISQTVAAATAGTTYELQVDVGFRIDLPDPGSVTLAVGADTAVATGTPAQMSGTFATYTAIVTASGADAGGPVTITLASPGAQGDFDDVRLETLPEPATLLAMGACLLGVAGFRRRGS